MNSNHDGRTKSQQSRRSRWPAIVVGMLAVHVLAMAGAVVIAVRSPYQVVPNYYERAVNWDKDRAAAAAAAPQPAAAVSKESPSK